MALDPFTTVFNALWEVLEEHAGFTELVKVGNRIKYNGDVTPLDKRNTSDADFPEVTIVPGDLSPHVFRTSNKSSFNRIFTVFVRTNEQRATASAFPVEWEVIRAIVAQEDLLKTIPFVVKCRPIQGSIDFPSGDDKNDGWVSIVSIEVEMWLETTDI